MLFIRKGLWIKPIGWAIFESEIDAVAFQFQQPDFDLLGGT